MQLREFFLLHKSDRQVLLTLLFLAALALSGIVLIEQLTDEPVPMSQASTDSIPRQTKSVQSIFVDPADELPERHVERFRFDPNTADSTQLLRLGLQRWQVRNIYKFRAAGGIYRRKEDFAQLYGLTQKEYRELEPYITISADYQPASLLVKKERMERDTLLYPRKLTEGTTIDLSLADTAQLRRVPGIGLYFAREIVRYRDWLGGYVSVDQLDEIEGFPSEAKKYFTISPDAEPRRLNLNRLSLNELKRHPYINYYQAKAIVDHRRLYGPISDLSELSLLPDFTNADIARLRPYVNYDD
jgi:DNA uptake protein ComE-like DNA-binding protein